jgi:hypothetical protein
VRFFGTKLADNPVTKVIGGKAEDTSFRKIQQVFNRKVKHDVSNEHSGKGALTSFKERKRYTGNCKVTTVPA